MGDFAIRILRDIALVALLAVSATIAGCQKKVVVTAPVGPAEPTKVCVDNKHQRAPDQFCATARPTDHIVGWYYMTRRAVAKLGIPALGVKVKGGSFSPQSGLDYDTAAPEGQAPSPPSPGDDEPTGRRGRHANNDD